MIDSALQVAHDRREATLARLLELLRIPSISMHAEHAPDMQRAVEWLVNHLRRIGMPLAEALPTGGYPAVYAEWLGAGAAAPTLLAYGHYDVQPVDPLDEWRSPPFEPVLRGADLFARGSSDDKGQLMALLAAAEASLCGTGGLPINLKILLEGEEELSSPNMATFVVENRALLTADAVLICDEALLDPQTPLILYGVRGNLYLEVEVRGPAQDLHSGTFGGAVENPFNVLVGLLARLRDPDTRRVLLPGFYDRVRPLDADERELLAQIPIGEAAICQLTGVPALSGEFGYTAVERASVRPTLEIHGMPGGYTGPGKKTVIPAWAAAKVSMRLVPDQDPDEIAALFEGFLRSLAPPTVQLQVRRLGSSRPVLVDYHAAAVQAMAQAFEQGFGAPPVYMRGGGSLPIARELQDVLDVPVILIGFGLPDDNTHAPNEKIHLPNLYRGTETLIHFFSLLAAVPGSSVGPIATR